MSGNSAVRKAAVLLAGGGVYGTAVYMTYHYTQINKQQEGDRSDLTSIDASYVNSPHRNQQYQRIASSYDHMIGKDEFFMGINLLRRSLLYFHAKGTVLEMAAGTGRNLKYYPAACQRVLMVDTSDQMLEQAMQKVREKLKSSSERFAVLRADCSELKTIVPDNAFDTVVDTFGLCSFDDPVHVLREMARVCKPGGKILLLEHGRSKSWNFVTNHLDKHAESHAKNWGCVWNRDLDQLLSECSDCLEVQILHKWHFGTTYYVVCCPRVSPLPNSNQLLQGSEGRHLM